MRKNREQRTLRLRRETLRALTDRALARVAGGSWGGVPGDDDVTLDCWVEEPQTYTKGSRYC